MFVGYLLGWDGYATLQQPVSSDVSGCKGVGIADLLLPSRIADVDACIARNWNRNSDCCPGCGQTSSNTPAPGEPNANPNPGNPIGGNRLPANGGATLV
jgi:hypothetical protein